MKIPLSLIDEKVSTCPNDSNKVSAMATKLKNGETLPPIWVRKEKDRYIVVDGNHRVKAHKQIGLKEIDVDDKCLINKYTFEIRKYGGEGSGVWKGRKAKYISHHSWIRYNYGRANCCENPNCTGKSKVYDWSNLSGEYYRDRKDYEQLCRSCHTLYHYSKKVKT